MHFDYTTNKSSLKVIPTTANQNAKDSTNGQPDKVPLQSSNNRSRMHCNYTAFAS